MKTILLITLSFMLNTNLYADHHGHGHGHGHKHEHGKEGKVEAAKPLRHVVMFKFKDATTKEQIAAIEKAFGKLPKKIETIKGYEWGTNVSKECRPTHDIRKLDRGFRKYLPDNNLCHASTSSLHYTSSTPA